jgi:hypothetical protein
METAKKALDMYAEINNQCNTMSKKFSKTASR